MKRKIKKALLFLHPATVFRQRVDVNPLPPLGLAYIGAVLEKIGIEVKIFDCLAEGWDERVDAGNGMINIGTSFTEIEAIIRAYGPDIVGVNSLFTTQRKNAHEIYALAKKVNKDIITVAGGAHSTAMPELVLSDPHVDFVVLGEGEDSIAQLVSFLEGDAGISTLDGIGHKIHGKIEVIPKTRFIESLDSIPFPAYHLLNMERYFGLAASHGPRKKKRFSPIVTSRGCTAGCSFCSAHKVWGKKFRYRSPENVVAELEYLKEKYGIEEIMFEDDNVTLNVKRAEKLFELMIEKKLGLVWDTPNGVAAWTLNETLIDKMKESGCYKINFPLETGNQHVMDTLIKKPVRLEKVKPLVGYARKIGLDVNLFLVIGMPGETEAEIWDSFRLAKELRVYFPHISIVTPYPGSELYDICVKNKYFVNGFSLDDLFIRSFCISTDAWDSEKLKDIYVKGQAYLLREYFKHDPVQFSIRAIKKIYSEPMRAARLFCDMLFNKKEWSTIR